MNTPTHEFVTVDMRGLKAALVARAQAERVSVSVVVRRAVERELGSNIASGEPACAGPFARLAGPSVKLSIRLTGAEAEQFDAGARRAGLSRGAFLAGLLANVPSLTGDSASRVDCLAALTASSAELSTLSRSINHLTTLLRRGEVDPAQQYRRLLDTLGDDVRAHLSLAAGVLADLRPARPSAKRGESRRPAAS
jgi:glutathione S-transferase